MFRSAMLAVALTVGMLAPLAATAAPAEAAVRIMLPSPVLVIGGGQADHDRYDHDRYERERRERARLEALRIERERREAYEHRSEESRHFRTARHIEYAPVRYEPRRESRDHDERGRGRR